MIASLASFLVSETPRGCFVLRGFAGTGKTTVVSAIVRTYRELGLDCVLAAPTGRAAKVMSAYSGSQAYTIHKLIYRRRTSDIGSRFDLDFNRHKGALFIIDEASMISNGGDTAFGTGSLLDDLISYVYQGFNCRLLLIGDVAQLPPVMYEESPALSSDILAGYGLDIKEWLLTNVVRQGSDSGILWNASMLRSLIDNPSGVRFRIFPDVVRVEAQEFVELIEESYRTVGEEEAIIIARSNKRAAMYAQGIRARVLWRETMLENGDLLMVVRNNYLVGEAYGLEFIANGDVAEVVRTRGSHELYGFHFREVTMRLVDYDTEIDALLLEESLVNDNPSELQKLSEQLFLKVQEDYMHIRNKRERYLAMRRDIYLNAIFAKSAYAVTCHKAQGGQWRHVYVDMGRFERDSMDLGLLRWLYTACTRATEKLFLVNFSDDWF